MGNKKVAVVLLEVKKVVQTPTKGVLGFPRCMEGGAKIILLPGQFYVGCQPLPISLLWKDFGDLFHTNEEL